MEYSPDIKLNIKEDVYIHSERWFMTNSIKDKSQNDVVMKEFWRNKEHFADIVNAVVFDGE